MGNRFKRSDPDIASALRRIAKDQIDKAIASANRDDDLHQGIHDARKKCKKLRGLFRLVRPAFPGYMVENAALRDAARHLAALRERGAGLETLDRLLAARPDDIDHIAAETLRAALNRRASAGAAEDLEARLVAFRSDLEACHARSAGWTLDKTGFSALGDGLHDTYIGSRKKMVIARRSRSPEDLHAWRKQVKYVWYHARLLKPIKAAKIKHRSAQAHILSDLLGDHHDLVDFRILLESGTLPGAASAALLAPTATEMARLENAAFDLGRKLFAKKPKADLEQWRKWWKSW